MQPEPIAPTSVKVVDEPTPAPKEEPVEEKKVEPPVEKKPAPVIKAKPERKNSKFDLQKDIGEVEEKKI